MTYQEKEKIENKVEIYADGACWQENGSGVGGWGVYMVKGDLRHPNETIEFYGGDSNTTNNKMEMTAAIMALKFLDQPTEVTLYTDSKYLVNGITMWIRGWKKNGWVTKTGEPVKNKELWQELDHLCTIHRINWQWVRGHNGNAGNERADALAVRGKEEEKERIRLTLSRGVNV